MFYLTKINIDRLLVVFCFLINIIFSLSSQADPQNKQQLIQFNEPSLSLFTVYSNDSQLSAIEAQNILQVSQEFWNTYIEKNVRQPLLVSKDGQFQATLQFDQTVAFLKITEIKSNKSYFHFLNYSPMQGDFKTAYLAEPSEALLPQIQNFKFNNQPTTHLTPDQFPHWSTETLKVQSEVEMLYQAVLKKWHNLIEQNKHLSQQEFSDQFIDKNAIQYLDKQFGTAEVNSVNGKPIIRIVHNATELSFIIAIEGQLDFNHKHFKQYIARQHISAGSSRQDGQFGRDVFILQVPKFETSIQNEMLDPYRYSQINRHRIFSGQWWSEYWLAIKKIPTLSEASFGVFSGSFQLMTTFTAAALLYPFGIEMNHMSATAMTALIYGSAFGTIASMFKNWERIGPTWRRQLKNLSNSLIFTYILSYVISGGDMSSLDPTTIDGLMNNARIWLTCYLSNKAKPFWYNIATLREKIGIARGNFNLGPIKTNWKKSNVEYQVAYIPNFFSRIIERINFGLPQTNPIGMLSILLQIPFSEWVNLKVAEYYAQKTQHPEAILASEKFKREWENKKRFYNDPTIPGLLLSKYFSFNYENRNSADHRLKQKYPEKFKAPEQRRDTPIVPFQIPQHNRQLCRSVFSI